MSNGFWEVLDPRGIPLSDTNDLAHRPSSLQEIRLGMLSNGKPNGDLLLKTIRQELEQRIHFTEVNYQNKRTSSIPAPEPIMEELVQCDAVITAVGD
ncbi:MAG: hypothetical protein OEU26_03080 [Candidatus Tectomicrobia bacterium]|nr:hypothetical protein [Candidatus Tectomicrobia bacterium]